MDRLFPAGLMVIPLLVFAAIVSIFLLPEPSTSSDVLEDVSREELRTAGVTILEEDPAVSPHIDYRDIARHYAQDWVALEAAELVALDLAPMPTVPGTPGYHVAWAVRLDPTQASSGFRRQTDAMIVFNDATTGEYLTTYVREPDTVTPTLLPSTPPPTP